MGRVLVATCGNCIAGDDSFGPRAGALLRQSPIEGVEVVDLDIKPAALFDHLPGPDCLVLVDAVRAEGRGGGELVVLDLRSGELPALLDDDAMSSHGLGLAHQLALARQLGFLPREVWLVGAALDSAEPGDDAADWMEDAVRRARARIESIAGSVRSGQV